MAPATLECIRRKQCLTPSERHVVHVRQSVRHDAGRTGVRPAVGEDECERDGRLVTWHPQCRLRGNKHDSIYALDANTGAILWQDSFIGATIVPRLNGETVTTLPSSPDSQSTNITPEIGILSTPVIDPSSNLLFLLTTTKESRYKNPANQALGFDTHYVQRLYGVDLGSGAVVKQTVVGDTIFDSTSFTSFTGYQYVAGPVINGTGNNGTVTINGTPTQLNDGWIANASGYNPMAQGQIAFNSLLQMNRPGLTLLNGVIYLGFASHGDKGPYYGWLLGYRTSDLANVVAFDAVTNHEDIIGNSDYTSQAGFWSGRAGGH